MRIKLASSYFGSITCAGEGLRARNPTYLHSRVCAYVLNAVVGKKNSLKKIPASPGFIAFACGEAINT